MIHEDGVVYVDWARWRPKTFQDVPAKESWASPPRDKPIKVSRRCSPGSLHKVSVPLTKLRDLVLGKATCAVHYRRRHQLSIILEGFNLEPMRSKNFIFILWSGLHSTKYTSRRERTIKNRSWIKNRNKTINKNKIQAAILRYNRTNRSASGINLSHDSTSFVRYGPFSFAFVRKHRTMSS